MTDQDGWRKLGATWFPYLPMSWDLRAESGELVAWHCLGGPPGWIGTDIRWTLSGTDTGTVVVLDHTGFAQVDAEYRIVTLGWAQMILHLKKYLETGEPTPFFTP
ncbi:MAG TPA: SRPBCC domain-containing protein [Candidatus Binatia bacterium]|nr:SRPBCC domain-containing protein [Candidatus Binatia bacterium]